MESEAGVAKWTKQIRSSGFSFVSDCPTDPATTESLLQRIAFIRPTQYGTFWDFTSSSTPTDTAYTDLPLAAHTDTTYFTDPCGLQMFHLLSHRNGSGGESLLADGFAAAAHLYQNEKVFYNILSSVRIPSHASGNKFIGSINNRTAYGGFPVFNHSSSIHSSPDHLTQIRWNNDDRAVKDDWRDRNIMSLWYAAAKAWNQTLKLPEFEIKVQLEPGKPLIFDNWRMLHGRTRFTGTRRVCGGYINMDDFMARWRFTNKLDEEAD